MGRTLNGVGAFFDGFSQAYDVTSRVLRDNELARIAKAGVKPLPGVPAGQAADLQAEGANDPGAAAALQPQRYEFLGKQYDVTPDEPTMTRDRQLAMAGVFEKYGEVAQGMGMRREVRRDQLADEGLRVARERQDWEKEDRVRRMELQRREDEYTAGRQAAFNNSVFGQRNAAYATALDKYHREQAAYDAAVEAGKPPPVAPTKPQPPQTSWGEALLDHATLLAHDIKYGKAGTQDMLKFAELQKALQDEGYAKALTIANSPNATWEDVVQAFNARGEIKIPLDGLIDIRTVDRGAGVKTRIYKFRGPDGVVQTIDTLAELDAIGKADKVFTRAFQMNTDMRGAAADARGAASAAREQARFDAEEPTRKLAQTVANLQIELVDPKTTPARRAEVRTLLAEGKGVDQNAPADVKLAQAWIRANGGKVSEKDALIWARTNQDKSQTAVRVDLVKAAMSAGRGAKQAQAMADEVMRGLYSNNGDVPASAPSAPTSGTPSPTSAVSIPPPAQRTVGQTYQTPRGPLVWRGNGWEQPATPASR